MMIEFTDQASNVFLDDVDNGGVLVQCIDKIKNEASLLDLYKEKVVIAGNSIIKYMVKEDRIRIESINDMNSALISENIQVETDELSSESSKETEDMQISRREFLNDPERFLKIADEEDVYIMDDKT